MKNEVQQLCEMLDDYSIMRDQDLPMEVWDFMKQKGFFGMIIPKQYGKEIRLKRVLHSLSAQGGWSFLHTRIPKVSMTLFHTKIYLTLS